ncbi:MAG: peptidylprolyl isomerase [Acidimicrobiales bacterium]
MAGLVVLAGCGSTSPSAAKVDGKNISQKDLEWELRSIGANRRFIESVESKVAVRGSGAGTFDATFTGSVLGRQIQYVLIAQEVKRRKLKITDADIQAARVEVADVAGGEEILTAFPKDYQDELVERAATVDALAVSLAGQPATDEAARTYYDTHKDEFTQVCVSHILVSSRDKEKAQQLKARIQGGEDFGAVARAESLDVASKTQNGDLGCNINRDSIAVPAFVDTVMTQPVNEVSDPIETNFGFHLIKVRSRAVPPYEQVADQAREKVIQASKAKLQEWITAAVDQAKVSVDPRYGTFDKAQLTVVPPVPTTTVPASTPPPSGIQPLRP